MHRFLFGYMASAAVVLALLSWAETGSLERGLRFLVSQNQLGKSAVAIVFLVMMQFVMFQLIPRWLSKPKEDDRYRAPSAAPRGRAVRAP